MQFEITRIILVILTVTLSDGSEVVTNHKLTITDDAVEQTPGQFNDRRCEAASMYVIMRERERRGLQPHEPLKLKTECRWPGESAAAYYEEL